MEANTGKLRMSSPTTTVDASDAIESSEVELDALVVNSGEKKRKQNESKKPVKKAKLEKERSKCDAAKLNPKEEPGPIITPDGDELYVVEKILSKEVGSDGSPTTRSSGRDGIIRHYLGAISKLGRCPELLLAFEMNSDVKAKETVEESAEQSDQQQDDEAEVEALGIKTLACDDDALEALDNQAMGGMFRRVWREEEIPMDILGSCSNGVGSLLHLVRIKTSVEEPDPENLYEGLNHKNCVMVLSDSFNRWFPTIAVNYLERCSMWVTSNETEEEVAKKAARAMVAHVCRITGTPADLKKIYEDMMSSTPTKEPEETTQDSKEPEEEAVDQKLVPCYGLRANKGAAAKNKPELAETDSFGLPLSMSSESDDSSDEEVIKVYETDRLLCKKYTFGMTLKDDKKEAKAKDKKKKRTDNSSTTGDNTTDDEEHNMT
ncbi:hypothetical protein Ocin01_18026 [Orchesella cincta]|uniref:Uncharacterized protein n=1 Tax=Orchesella cincta TaxID=48709 RepID=A0A1D2M6R7_ORCCI|nr:hypothetical protein Ocin01_18026 [Orchesella cincta]